MDPILLEEMGAAELMNRKDTKFFFPVIEMESILAGLQKEYRVFEIEKHRISHYENIYFDTLDRHFYYQHHNGRLNRYKFRIRKYTKSALAFLEVKFKSNKGRTIKSRVQVPVFSKTLDIQGADFIRKNSQVNPDTLQPVMNIQFDRITVVKKDFSERATIDFNVIASNQTISKSFDHLAIAELKQDGIISGSEFKAVLRRHHGVEKRLSKYCICLSALESNLKQNAFKPKHLYISKLKKNTQYV